MFSIDMHAYGLGGIQAILKELAKTGGQYSGAELRGLPRSDEGINNAVVIEKLNRSGRAFDEITTTEAEQISKVAAEKYEELISRALKRAQAQAKKAARAAARSSGIGGRALSGIGNTASSSVSSFARNEKWSRQTSAAVLREAMREYMRIVANHINTQTAPGGLKPLSESYRKQKLYQYGFETIGKATGQLIENLDIATAEKGIRLIRK